MITYNKTEETILNEVRADHVQAEETYRQLSRVRQTGNISEIVKYPDLEDILAIYEDTIHIYRCYKVEGKSHQPVNERQGRIRDAIVT